MPKSGSSEAREPNSPVPSSSSSRSRENNGIADVDDPESTVSTVARQLEQLHAIHSSPLEREEITSNLLCLAREKKEARILIGSHNQSMPLFVSILRSGTHKAKSNTASLLTALCKEDELRVRVLLGGCIPPLLSLLQSGSPAGRRSAAEAIFQVSSGGLSDDHIGMKIFITEGVVPTLWSLLGPASQRDRDNTVEGFITGALRNLCGEKDGYWRATLEAGGVEIITNLLLSSDNPTAQANAASLLARLISAFADSVQKILDSGAVTALLNLLAPRNEISVRAGSADALQSLSVKSAPARRAMVVSGGVPVLIGSVVAPSKECMDGGNSSQSLQNHAIRTLSNICGGMSELVLYLGEICQSGKISVPLTDVLGALAYSLMVFDGGEGKVFDPVEIEGILVNKLKPDIGGDMLVRDRVLEALASLYGNNYLSSQIDHSEAKKVIIGLITMGSAEVQEHLILSLTRLCGGEPGLWDSLGKREGVQLLISLLGLSSEQHQEYSVSLLSILTDQVDESKWAITAAGGIPPVVQLLESGSQRARRDAAHVLWNLCCHSDDIRACVESAGAVSSLLFLLKSGNPKAQEESARALKKLIRSADPTTINQLLALLLTNSVNSKSHIVMVLGHVLMIAPYKELVRIGSPANKGLKSLVQVLNSSDEEMQEYSASVLADLFTTRPDICDSLATDEIIHPCMRLLTSQIQVIATQSARALGALSRKSKNNRVPYIGEADVGPLVRMAGTALIGVAETAVAALANLLLDPQIAGEAVNQDVVPALKRVLAEGTVEGKNNAARSLYQLLYHFPIGEVLIDYSQCRFVVQSVLGLLADVDLGSTDGSDALDLLSLLARTKQGMSFGNPPWAAIADVADGLAHLVKCIEAGQPPVQEKAIEILSRVCQDRPALVGQLLAQSQGCIFALASRVLDSTSVEARIGATALLTCTAREDRDASINTLTSSGVLNRLIYSLVDMMRRDFSTGSLEIEVWNPKRYADQSDECGGPNPVGVLGGTVALWLLAVLSSCSAGCKPTLMEAGGVEILSDKLASYTSNNALAEYDEMEGIWSSALVLSILFQDLAVIQSSSITRTIPSLVSLLKSDDLNDRYFAAQSLNGLVRTGNKGTQLAVANSGAVSGLIALVGHVESDMQTLISLSREFELPADPSRTVLENLFELDEVRTGATARKSIPLLVDLLRPMPDRPGAPPVALDLLTRLAQSNETNRISMADSGALDALTKYLSLGPQDPTETKITDLLGFLYRTPELVHHESSLGSLKQLIAVLRLGSRNSRLSAARALQELFNCEGIRETDHARQSIQPLIEMLDSGNENEQLAAVVALTRLTAGSTSKANALTELDPDPLVSLYKILSLGSSPELNKSTAELCYVLFGNPTAREKPVALECVPALMSLAMSEDSESTVGPAIRALERLLDDEQNANLAATYELVHRLVGFISTDDCQLAEACISALIKLGKDRPNCKLDMVRAGVVDHALGAVLDAPVQVSASIAELLRILTNNSGIAKSPDAARMVEPLFILLQQPDFTMWGQHSALQALVNILEKPQSLANLRLTPSQAIEPLISFLESPSQAIQQLGTEVLTHLLEQEHFKQDITTKNAVVPLVQLAGIGILNLQQTAIKALESISLTWPKAVAEAGGILELSKLILQDDPRPGPALWESAALVLSNVLRSSTDNYVKISILVLVRLLNSTVESTVTVALNALLVQQKKSNSSAVSMAEAGAIEALLELLKSHQCEEPSGRLLEALFNNVRVREMKVTKYAIGPLCQYLLDPQTRSSETKFLVTLALGDLFQHETLARSRDSASACRALIGVLEEQPPADGEEMALVALCALQSLVMNSRTNRRAVAEAGGVLLVQELLLSQNADVAGQAALLIRYLFSNHTLQEYVSNELVQSLTAALEKELLLSGSTVSEEILKTICVIFSNFKKLRTSESATLCIPHLVNALKSGSESAQETVLDSLCLLKESWPNMSEDIAKAQSLIAAESIPDLQMLMKTCPPSFQERADSLLHCLPGCLTVTIKRGNNLKQTMGNTNAFCCLKIGNGPPKQTRVVNHSICPEWKEAFTWAFDVPPKGQKLFILCKSKNTFGKSTLGRVTIQIDKVVTEGVYSGMFSLSHDGSKDSSRTLEIEFVWSNRTSADAI